LSTLNVQGFLLKKASKLYQLLTVDYWFVKNIHKR
jgi:hypothetical protein